MKVFLEEAREELKRADHLIYVSLKYTRTVDVIKSVIDRLISCLDFVIDKLLDHAIDKKLISEKPSREPHHHRSSLAHCFSAPYLQAFQKSAFC